MPDQTKESYQRIEYAEFFHAWRADSRGEIPDVSKQVTFENGENRIRLFWGDENDPSRTNMLIPGCFPRDMTFRVKEICISTRFSNTEHVAELIRSGHADLCVGDHPIFPIIFKLIADPERNHVFDSEIETTGLPKRVLTKIPLRLPIAIPARQGIYVDLQVAPILAQKLNAIEQGKVKEFAEIEIILCGTKNEFVNASNLTPDELEQARAEAKEHLQMLQEIENQYPPGQKWGLSEEEARRLLKEKNDLRSNFTFTFDRHNIVMREKELEARLNLAISGLVDSTNTNLPSILQAFDSPETASEPDAILGEINNLLDGVSAEIARDLHLRTRIKVEDQHVKNRLIDAVIQSIPQDKQSMSLMGEKMLKQFPEQIITRFKEDFMRGRHNATDLDFLREMGRAGMEVSTRALKNGSLSLEKTRKIIYDILGVQHSEFADDGWTPTSYLDK